MSDERDRRSDPVLIHLDGEDTGPGPGEAPPVPDTGLEPPEGRAMQTVAVLAARRASPLARWFWRLSGALVGALVSYAAWEFVIGLIASTPVLGYAFAALFVAFLLVVLAIAVREIAAFSRLARMDRIFTAAEEAIAADSLTAAREVSARIAGIYAGRAELEWGLKRIEERAPEQFDATAVLALTEAELLAPLDAAALREVEAAARQVATVTALVPLAFADVAAAMTSNLRMIRRIAEVYGGRSGTLGSLRLTRAVMTHLVATGAVAVGDDMIGSILGGNLLTRLSRRFGEGVVNGALTARVGVAAMEVCRPLPFSEGRRPSVTGIIRRALTGLFGNDG
ncbi:TIGR01620 family protein [Pseudooceanicola sp. 216_PA32_1]|uniref:TIGR01620 family protein n=1 Tax=Pseudooceanicola pacificus TaxID=2676438 RepID=A0A844WE43_9RHOB|nr:TIGR01620 family protein [Pseudooceanicola pacificus]MWB79538.1 TIGR01620 family protein [Pseudooceanicola pacificus]